MPTFTTNLALTKPVTSDTALIGDINTNMDTLDDHRHRGATNGLLVDTLSAAQASGDLFYATGANALNRLAIGATGGLLRVTGGAPAWLAVGSNGQILTVAAGVPTWAANTVTSLLAGSDTTDRSTTSTTAADLATVTVSIPATQAFVVVASLYQAGSGGSSYGLRLNATDVLTPISELVNSLDSGFLDCRVMAHDATFLRTGYGVRGSSFTAASTTVFTADVPTATITSVIVRGLVSGSATLHCRYVYVYALPTT